MVWLIAYAWAAPGARLLSLREGEAERVQGVVLTEHRGKGIVPWVLSELSSIAFAMGLRKLLGVIATNNVPALRAVQKIGGRKTGRIYRFIGPPFLGFRQWIIRRDIRR
jgi:RimJ/RimL family protein N-acetyltransferase